MNKFIQGAVSLIERGIGACQLPVIDSASDVILTGYNYSSTDKPLDVLPENRGCRLAGILYADIADFDRLTEQGEDGTQYHLVESMKVMRACVAANNGRIAHSSSDAILAEFKDPDNALHCAISVQLAAQQWNASLPIEQQVRFRVGINFDEPISGRNDLYSKAVALAGRLESQVCSGGIWVYDALSSQLEDRRAIKEDRRGIWVYDALSSQLENRRAIKEDRRAIKFVAMGEQYVNNIGLPVQDFWIEVDSQYVADSDFTGAVKFSAVAS